MTIHTNFDHHYRHLVLVKSWAFQEVDCLDHSSRSKLADLAWCW